MKLATLASQEKRNRNGELILVSSDNSRGVRAPKYVASTLLEALQNWSEVKPLLEKISASLNEGSLGGAFPLDIRRCLAPLPNAPGFYDGSAFLSHVYRARKARGDNMPESAKKTPLMYQGVSDGLLPATSPLEIVDEAYGGDFEGEFAVVTTDVPRGTSAANMDPYIALFCLFNDITLREIVKVEIETKFGFLQSKPNSSFAPLMVTPDELGPAWKDGRVHLEMQVDLNGARFGHPHGREMHFSFQELVAHAARTRPLSAGSIVGSGTVSNEDKTVGFTCLTEKRFQEILDTGKASTPWLKPGDQVYMNVMNSSGRSVFGVIDQKVRL